jgi:hypothetical protein
VALSEELAYEIKVNFGVKHDDNELVESASGYLEAGNIISLFS